MCIGDRALFATGEEAASARFSTLENNMDTFELAEARFRDWLQNHGIAGMAAIPGMAPRSSRDTQSINIPVVVAVDTFLKNNPSLSEHRDRLIAFGQSQRAMLGGTYALDAEKWRAIQG
jgi:hypothetical protein